MAELLPVIATALGPQTYAPVFQQLVFQPLLKRFQPGQPDGVRSTMIGQRLPPPPQGPPPLPPPYSPPLASMTKTLSTVKTDIDCVPACTHAHIFLHLLTCSRIHALTH